MPAAHAVGAMDAAGQKLPAGHSVIVDGVGQKKPAVQFAGADEPVGQYTPDVNEHCIGVVEAATGQKLPRGHGRAAVAVQ